MVRDAMHCMLRDMSFISKRCATPPGVEMNLSRSAGSGEDVSHVRHEARDDEANLARWPLGQSRPAIAPQSVAMRLIIGHEERLDVPRHVGATSRRQKGVSLREFVRGKIMAKEMKAQLTFTASRWPFTSYMEKKRVAATEDAEEPRFHGDEVLG